MSCKLCNSLKKLGQRALLLDNYNMQIEIKNINNSYYITASGAPGYQGEQDYGRAKITNCPRCGGRLK